MFIKIILIISIITNILLYLSEFIAWKLKIIDYPNKRKIHTTPTPRTGGIAIFLSFLLSLPFIYPYSPNYTTYFVIATFIIFILGLYDDLFKLSAWRKLLGEFIATTIIIFFCGITFKIGGNYQGIINSTIISIIFTYLWIIGVTNAINLIDGMDGLASGISLFAFGAILIVAISKGMIFQALISAVFIGSILSFLNYNLPKAKIFLGDSGSLVIGFLISISSLTVSYKTGTLISVIFPSLFVLIPVVDTALSFIRRLAEKKNPLTTPDKKHIHHRLLTLKFSHNQALIIFYFLSGIFTAIAINTQSKNILSAIIFSLSLILTILVILYLFERNKFDKKIEKFNNFTDKLKKQLKNGANETFIETAIFFLITIIFYFVVLTGLITNKLKLPISIHEWFNWLLASYIIFYFFTTPQKKGSNLLSFFEFIIDWVFCIILIYNNKTPILYSVLAITIIFSFYKIIVLKKYAALIPSPPDILLLFSFIAINTFIGGNSVNITKSFLAAGILQLAKRSTTLNKNINNTEQKTRKYIQFIFAIYLLIRFLLFF